MVSRRKLVTALSTLGGLAGIGGASTRLAGQQLAAPSVIRPPEQRYAGGVDAGTFARANASGPQGEALQAALDAAVAAGVGVHIPAGRFVTERPLAIRNRSGRDMAMPHIRGAGVGATVIAATAFAGPVLTLRGVTGGAMQRGHFGYGGGLTDLEIRGAGVALDAALPRQHGVEVLGWWNGRIERVRIAHVTGDGLRAAGDRDVDPNPDWTASILALSGVQIERVGGWCFRDDNPIGAPGWLWRNCILTFGGEGGARISSSGTEFATSSFSGAGWISETVPGRGPGYGVWLVGEAGTISRTRFRGCEFDTSRGAHLVLDKADATVVEQTRFIHHDRYGAGHLTPPIGVTFASRGDASRVAGARFEQVLFRIDTPGAMTGFKWAATANVVDIAIDGTRWSDETQGKVALTRFGGHEQRNAHLANHYRIIEQGHVVSGGVPAPFLLAALGSLRGDRSAGAGAFAVDWRPDPAMASLYGGGGPGFPVTAGKPLAIPQTAWWRIEAAIDLLLAEAASARRMTLRLDVGARTWRQESSVHAGQPTRLALAESILANAGDEVRIQLESDGQAETIGARGGRLAIRMQI